MVPIWIMIKEITPLTKADVLKLIEISVPAATTAGRTEIAESALSAAITRLGKIKGVTFNEELIEFDLESGKQDYKLGSDIFKKYESTWSIENMGRTDQAGWNIEILGFDDFQDGARGGRSTGIPAVATIFKQDGSYVLRVYPIPDSAYACEAQVRIGVTRFEDIPSVHHDALVSLGQTIIKASADPMLSLTMAKDGIKEIQGDSPTGWDGSVIGLDRPLDVTGRTRRSDSGNLRP